MLVTGSRTCRIDCPGSSVSENEVVHDTWTRKKIQSPAGPRSVVELTGAGRSTTARSFGLDRAVLYYEWSVRRGCGSAGFLITTPRPPALFEIYGAFVTLSGTFPKRRVNCPRRSSYMLRELARVYPFKTSMSYTRELLFSFSFRCVRTYVSSSTWSKSVQFNRNVHDRVCVCASRNKSTRFKL